MNERRDNLTITRLYEVADEIGRLRRHLNPEPGSLVDWRLERLASQIESLLGIYEPTAAELAGWWAPGDNQAATTALELVDGRHAWLRRKLGCG